MAEKEKSNENKDENVASCGFGVRSAGYGPRNSALPQGETRGIRGRENWM